MNTEYVYFKYKVSISNDTYIAKVPITGRMYEYRCVDRSNGKGFAWDEDDSWVKTSWPNPTHAKDFNENIIDDFYKNKNTTKMTDEEVFLQFL